MTMKTWRELEAEGVKRCCVMFKDGHRCRRRAVVDGWCAKHGPIMEQITAEHMKLVRQDAGEDA
jgi:hypothetical protein